MRRQVIQRDCLSLAILLVVTLHPRPSVRYSQPLQTYSGFRGYPAYWGVVIVEIIVEVLYLGVHAITRIGNVANKYIQYLSPGEMSHFVRVHAPT